MAYLFDETDDHLLVTDAAVLSVTGGSWTMAGWLKLTDNTGTLFQYFFSWGALAASPSINMFVVEASAASNANKLSVRIFDAGGDTFESGVAVGLLSTSDVGSSTNWQHIAVRHSGNDGTLWINGTQEVSVTNANVGSIDVGTNLYLGARQDLNVDRFYGGDMAEWAKWDVALDTAEISALNKGASPRLIRPSALAWHLPLVRNLTDQVGGLSVSAVNGPTVSGHVRIINPRGRQNKYKAAAAAAGRIWRLAGYGGGLAGPQVGLAG